MENNIPDYHPTWCKSCGNKENWFDGCKTCFLKEIPSHYINERVKLKTIGKVMEELEQLYNYALGLIGKEKTHSLGHKKEHLKQTIENAMKVMECV